MVAVSLSGTLSETITCKAHDCDHTWPSIVIWYTYKRHNHINIARYIREWTGTRVKNWHVTSSTPPKLFCCWPNTSVGLSTIPRVSVGNGAFARTHQCNYYTYRCYQSIYQLLTNQATLTLRWSEWQAVARKSHIITLPVWGWTARCHWPAATPSSEL